jgi:hypothetical protein
MYALIRLPDRLLEAPQGHYRDAAAMLHSHRADD